MTQPEFIPVLTQAGMIKAGDTILFDEKRTGIAECRVLECETDAYGYLKISLRQLDSSSESRIVCETTEPFYVIKHCGHRKLSE